MKTTTDHAYRRAGFPVARRSRRDVRLVAHYLLNHVSKEIGWLADPFPIVDLLELWAAECGPTVERDRPNIDICEPDEIPHADAEFIPHRNVIRIDRQIWDDASDGDPLCHWILAHETGHVLLKHYASAGLYRDGFKAVDPETDSEHQANWFADELLMDSRKIDLSTDGTTALIQRFSVSSAMAVRRLRELILESGSAR